MDALFINEFELTYRLYREWAAHPVGKKAKSARTRSLILAIVGIGLSLLILADGLFWIHDSFAIIAGCVFLALFLARLFVLPAIALRRQFNQLKTMSPDGKLPRRHEFGEEIRVISGRVVITYKYSELTELSEDERHFLLHKGENEVLRLPKNAFILGDADSFRAFILERIGAPQAQEA